VQRQLEDCRAEAKRLGWTVAEEYVDDDISAYSGRTRPAYQRMLLDLADGQRDAIITWHMDRLHRQPIELEELLRVCALARVTDLRTVQGAYDLGTGDGMLVARVLAAFAAQESDRKRHRGKRKALQVAESGKPHMGGGYRPFGFQDDRVTHDPTEATIIRDLTERTLAGESLTSMCKWLVDEQVTTVSGATWRTPVLRQMLLNPRMYGMRTHNGEIVGPAVWEPIISPEKGEALRLLLTDPKRRTNRTARRYLLSGHCRCSLCGGVMFSVPRHDERRYICRSGHDFGGCGRMTINALGVERIVTEAVLIRLDSPELHDALAGRVHDDAEASALAEHVAADTAQLKELAEIWAQRQISTDAWAAARTVIEDRRAIAKRKLGHLSGTRHLDAYIGQGGLLRKQWADLNLSRQVAIVRAIIEHVEILPGKMGTSYVDVGRVRPVWRF
jgi:DNA invertase Pin-like site-specific DNA recombinase